MDETMTHKLPVWVDEGQLGTGGAIVLEQFRRREPVHAYLISGAQGLGKATFAKVLACTLFCGAEGQKPCGVCAGCRSVLADQNPDVVYLAPESSKSIGVDKVRGVIETISQHAFGAGYRVVIIRPVEKLTPQAQNALLKSLEEPVSNVVFLLLAHEMTALLGTIASRCARVKLTPWQDAAMAAALDSLGYAQADIQRTLPLASGNIGRALEMLSDDKHSQDTDQFLQKALMVHSDADVVSISTSLKDAREGAERYVSVLEEAIHLALLTRTGQLDASALQAYPQEWQDCVSVAAVEGLTGLLKAVFQTRRLLAGQVNWQSTIDHLMMNLLEERRKWQQLLA